MMQPQRLQKKNTSDSQSSSDGATLRSTQEQSDSETPSIGSKDRTRSNINNILLEKTKQDFAILPQYSADNPNAEKNKQIYLDSLKSKGYDIKPIQAANVLEKGASQGAQEPTNESQYGVPQVEQPKSTDIFNKATESIGGYIEGQAQSVGVGAEQFHQGAKQVAKGLVDQQAGKASLADIGTGALNMVAGGAKSAFGIAGLVMPQMIAFNAATEGVHALPDKVKAGMHDFVLGNAQGDAPDSEKAKAFDKVIDLPFASVSAISEALDRHPKEGSAEKAAYEIGDILLGAWGAHKISSGGAEPKIKDTKSLVSIVDKMKNGEASDMELKDYTDFSNSLKNLTLDDVQAEAERQGKNDISDKISEIKNKGTFDQPLHPELEKLHQEKDNWQKAEGYTSEEKAQKISEVDKKIDEAIPAIVNQDQHQANIKTALNDIDTKIQSENDKLKINSDNPTVTQDIEKNIDILDKQKEELINQLKPEQDAIQEQSPSGVLQHPQEGVGETGSERQRVEPGVERVEATQENPVIPESENAPATEKENVLNETFGITQEEIGKSAQEHGFKEAVDQATQSAERDFGTVWENAKEKINSKNINLEELRKKLAINPAESNLNLDETNALLLHDQINLEGEFDKVVNEINNGNHTESRLSELQNEKAKIEDDLFDNYVASKKVGTEQGRGLNARRLLADKNYSLVNLKNEMRAAQNGEPLTASQEKFVEERYAAIKEKAKAWDDFQKQKPEWEQRFRDKVEKEIEEKFGKEKRTISQQGKKIANSIRKLKSKNTILLDEKGLPILDSDGKEINISSNNLYNDAIEVVASAIEKGAELAQAIQKGIEHLRDQDFYKNLSDKNKEAVDKSFEKNIKDKQEEVSPKSNLEKLTKRSKDLTDKIGEAKKEKDKDLDKLQKEKALTEGQISSLIKEIKKDKQEEVKLEAQKKRYQKRIEDYRAKRLREDFSPTVRDRMIYDEESLRLQSELQNEKDLFMMGRENARLSKRGWTEKGLNAFNSIIREGLLSSPKTLMKLLSFDLYRSLVIRPLYNLSTPLLKSVPKISKIASKAASEGDVNFKALGKGLSAFKEKNTYQQMWNKLSKKGKSDLDLIYGDKRMQVPMFATRTHGAVKQLGFTNEYNYVKSALEQTAEKAGQLDDPATREFINRYSYTKAMDAIYMGESKTAKQFQLNIRMLENKGDTKSLLKAAGLKFLFPIVKVPMNFAKDVMWKHTPMGLTKAAIESYKADVDKLTPEQADGIMLALKKGAVGTAMMTLGGYALSNSLGGFYSKESEKDKKGLEEGEVKVGHTILPAYMNHNAIMASAQAGAEVVHLFHSAPKSYGKPEKIISSILMGAAEGLNQIPFYGELSADLRELGSHGGQAKLAADKIGQSIPALVQWTAGQMDTGKGEVGFNPFSKPRKVNKNEGFFNTFKKTLQSKVPIQRNKLKTRKEK